MEKELIFDIFEKISNRSDLDWIEIRDKHNLDCHPDTLRKAGVGIKMAAEAGALSFNTGKDNSQDELYKAKRQFYDQRREYNKLLIEEARSDHLTEELIRCAETLNEKKILDLGYSIKQQISSGREAVLFISDWHFGLTAENVWNRFNPDIADKRIQLLAEKTVNVIRRNNIETLHVVLLGDLISGSCHQSIRVQNCENSIDQLMNVSERIAELISYLADEVNHTVVYSTYGNHARVTQVFGDSIHSENMERIIPFWLKQRLKHRDDIAINENNMYELLRIVACGHEIAAVHGDLDAGKSNSMLTMSFLYEKNFGRKMEYMVLGHWHKRYTDENLGIEQIGVGSLCGTDEYAKNKRLFSKPTQTLLVFTAEGLEATYNIDLTVE